MISPSPWQRLRRARIVRIAAVYLAASWLVLQVTFLFVDAFDLPRWFVPAAVLLLLIGLVVITATALVQAHPSTALRAERDEIPGSWDIDLGEVRQSVASGRLPHLTWGRSILGGVVAFALLFGLAAVYVLTRSGGGSFAPKEAVAEGARPGVAVLPFNVKGKGLDPWREGMVDLLSTNLDGAAGLRAVDSRTVLAAMQGDAGAETPDAQAMLATARSTGARYAVLGTAVSVGVRVRVAADVFELEPQERLGQISVEGHPDSVFGLVDELTVKVLSALLRSEEGELRGINLARITTASVPALKAFLEGESAFRQSRFDDAIPAYERAVEADSTFALALYRLANAYGWAEGINADLTEEYGERAARWIERLPEREAMLLRAELALTRGELEAIDLLREATRRYPDDVEAWHSLGDAYEHLGEQAGLPSAEVERAEEQAFARALELDPHFATAYIHRIQRAMAKSDSAASAELLARYGELSRGSRYDTGLRLAWILAFGDSASRRRAWAAVDTVPTGVLGAARDGLWHPRFYEIQRRILDEQSGRHDATATAPLLRVVNAWNRGRPRQALEYLNDPRLRAPFRAGVLLSVHEEHGPVSRARLDRELSLSNVPEGEPDTAFLAFYAGMYAADLERWDEHSRATSRLQEDAARFLSVGDSVSARVAAGASRGVSGYGLLRQGRLEEAMPELDAACRKATGYGAVFDLNRTLRWAIAKRLLEAGRLREAEYYMRAFRDDPWAAWHLGHILERLEKFAEARAAYDYAALAWRDAEPELRPRVEEARVAIRRLSSVVRE